MKVLKEWTFKKLTGQWRHAYGATPEQSKRVVKPDSVATQWLQREKSQILNCATAQFAGKSSLFRHVQIFAAAAEEHLQSYSWCATMKEVKQWQAADLHKTKVIASQSAPLWFIALLHHILVQLPIGFEDHLRFLKKSGKPPTIKNYNNIQKDTSMGGCLIYCPFCMQ